jgi:Right handed beta helix region
MRRISIFGTFAACALAFTFAAADGAATEPATLIVDRDGVQCSNAGFTSIQAAVDAAQPGDLIRVCPDLYTETVVIDKPLTLKADPDAIEAIDCFQPTLDELPADQQAIVDPAGDGFSIAFKLEADDIALEGFVVQGATVGIDASDRFYGYRIHHNLVRSNTLFGVDFGSEGTRASRVDHNCVHDNRWGLVSELDDDSVWPDLGHRMENARDLVNARIDHNLSFRNSEAGLEAAGPGRRQQVTFEHNVLRNDLGGILLQNSTDSAILDNEITDSRGNAIVIGGGNEDLLIGANRVLDGGLQGIFFVETFIDRFPIPSTNVSVVDNDVRSVALTGIVANPGNLAFSVVARNTTSDNGVHGISLFPRNTNNLVLENHANNNMRNGIFAQLGATANTFERNSMHGNGTFNPLLFFDARDNNTPINVWTNNDCDTDFPTGAICGIG